MKHTISALMFVCMAIASCEKPFQTHPYDVDYSAPTGINATQIAHIAQRCEGKDTLRVAFISDTHEWYSDFEDEVEDINRRDDSIDFVIHCGDLTDEGTNLEYITARRILLTLHRPVVTLIGNHDFLGTGDQSYRTLFGPMDFSFVAGGIKFLCINTNATEYDHMADVPDFDFIARESVDSLSTFAATVAVMHAPPYSDQFNNNIAKPFRTSLSQLPTLLCCIYGHNHNTADRILFDNDTLTFHGVASAEKRQYRIFTFTRHGYESQVVTF